MSIQWTLVAGVMYMELALTLLLLLPFISPQRWHKFFKSSFLRSIGNMGHIYFKIFLGILILFFVDSIREMRKYNRELDDGRTSDHGHHLDADMQAQIRIFRAQRNFYISGFSLFLWIVLQRLATLLSRLAITMAEKEAAMRQAQSATQAAEQLMKEKPEGDDKESKEAAKEKKDREQTLLEENKKLKVNLEAVVSQSKQLEKEYDRLMEECATLQKKIDVQGDKKAD